MSVQLLVSGISLGAVYALIAVGFAIVFSILKFSNFAHGGMISACAFIGFFFQRMFVTPPPFLLTVVFTTVCGIVMSLFIDTIAYRRIRIKQAPNIYYFFLSVLIYVINRTRVGLAIRAVAINPATSRLMGINSDRTIMLVFAIAGALAGVSGVLLGAKYSVYPTLGSSMMLKGFIASVIGGLGSLGGAITAAIGLGVIEIILTYFFGALSIPIFLFGIMLIFLAVRPEGISGKFAKDKV